MSKITHSELPPEISSRYLSDGFARDLMRIYDVAIDLDEKTVQAKMDLQDPYVSFYGPNPEFFLSVVTAYRFVNQLINAYVCTLMESNKTKLGKFFAISNEMKTSKPITNPRSIEAKVNCTRDLVRKNNRFMEFQFDIQNGAFTGNIRGCGKR